MKQLFALILTCVWVSAATPSFSSFNTNQFSTNNLFISIKDGAVITNLNVITDLFINSTNIVNLFAPSSVTNSGDSLWFNVGGYATLTNNMQGVDIGHDSSNGDDPDIDLDLFATMDGAFTDYGNWYAIATTNSVLMTMTADSGGVQNTALIIDITNNGGTIELQRAGSVVDGFRLVTPSGYTGGGTLFLSDDGTYKAAGGGGGDSIWTNITGYVTMIPGQTATNTLSFVSGAADNATNVVLSLDTANAFAAAGSKLANFSNASTNVYQFGARGSLAIGRANIDDNGEFILTAERSVQAGDPQQLVEIYLKNSNTNSFTVAEIWADNGGPGFTDTAYDAAMRVSWFSTNATDAIQVKMEARENSDAEINILKNYFTTLMSLNPTVASSGTAVAYKLDTANLLNTSGDLLATFRNAGTNVNVITPFGGVGIGQNLTSFTDFNSDKALSVFFDESLGESVSMNATFSAQADNTYTDYSQATFLLNSDGGTGRTNRMSKLTIEAANNDSQLSQLRLQNFVGTGKAASGILFYDENDIRMRLQPRASSGGSVPYLFDTSNSMVDGDKFVSIGNAGTEVLNISPNSTGAQIVFGPGSTNVLSRSGSSLVYTNADTAGYGIKIQDPSDASKFAQYQVLSGGSAKVLAATGASVFLSPDNGSVGYAAVTSGFKPNQLSTDLGGTATNDRWRDLHLDRNIVWNGTTNTLFDTWGIATPEGAQAARPGSVFRNTADVGVLSVKTDGTGNTGWQSVHVGNQAYLAANGTVSDATLVNLSLSVGVTSGKKYAFRCVIYCANSTAGDGVKIDFDGGSAAATNFRAHTKITDAALLTSTQTSALATDITAATITGDTEIEVNGSFEPSGTGTLIPRFAENSDGGGTLTVYRGSHLILTEIP